MKDLVLTYILVLILVVIDFWVVKNVTGRYALLFLNSYRILAGLRWWSEIKPDGKEEWVFESMDISTLKILLYKYVIENTNKSDNRVFWVVNYVTPFTWGLLIIFSILKFEISNVTICLIALILSATNLMGYRKCEKNHS